MAVSKKLRFEVFKRDLFTCRYCGQRPPQVLLELDHVVPLCEGGPDLAENLVAACQACNRGKAGKRLDDVVPPLDELEVLASFQDVLERRQRMEESIVMAEESRATEERAQAAIDRWWTEEIDDQLPRKTVFRKFIGRLDLEEIRYAIEATAAFRDRQGRNRYAPMPEMEDLIRYFCKVCWNRITELEGRPT